MWLFTKYGMFSAVAARKGPNLNDPVNPDLIQVRARQKEHLTALKKRFKKQLKRNKIHEFDRSDYRYRIFVGKNKWVKIVTELAQEVDYDNFKTAVYKEQGKSAYEAALHRVWSVMYELQHPREVESVAREWDSQEAWWKEEQAKAEAEEEQEALNYLRYHTQIVNKRNQK